MKKCLDDQGEHQGLLTRDDRAAELFKLFEIQGIPTTVLLDRDGQIVGVNLRGEKLVEKVESLMG